ncbi:bifunctional 4-hydroxy-2-oxoglutarate aldolase/2-dehydro-3-deoxy-phosphogluconate aldolase [Fictibacillus terranigra]|uniref:Bifunctional 4-hydroxy-2-oxoglutarate aldolase/2-dehydro-3-deoxy-phosphogluconate aldolase n=1 Tax=Fictibacillus terranigra TaxID=3058424 RepID=A0ABT8EDN6_9BACL|nr:bifunctional 4-hydroxy-2-oxoglutarate aldolase/2-dehydro-3-deoxy-phosphogluconate aldolase [Fictibacillus sp. CENA-BCM004]MDN4076030.1 bifunctional 4-hydroxy-2-oxoglutarate aldolase/2-dehydro-3-deoxy-phosphogluconate aldolase [Fictibacillus sp. CENA-BCM004]
MPLLDRLKKEKLIAIARNVPEYLLDQTAESLLKGGIVFIEITLNTPDALPAIERWKRSFGDEILVGAGTVLDLQMARDALSAGAEYLITPNLDEEVVEFATGRGIDVWPGVMTPTEMVKATKAGARAVKLFPSGTLGSQYIKDVRGPLHNIPLIATGGIHLGNLKEFLDAGATAAGLGSSLVDNTLIKNGNFDEITDRARRFRETAKEESGVA